MALLASNFAANSLTGNVVVSNGQANINLGAINYTALEGTKTFYVKLRKYSNTGALLGISNAIIIPDRTGVTSLVANVITIRETNANIVSYTITTANVIGDVTLNWRTTGTATGDDFIANTGTVLISNNVGTFTTRLASDFSGASETDEYYGIQLLPTSEGQTSKVIYTTPLANIVTVIDTSYAPIVNSITPNVFFTYDSSIISFAITTTNAGNTTLYYSTVGSLPNTEIVTANTGSFTPTSDSNTTSITIRVGSIAVSDPRNFKLQIREQSPAGNIKFTGSNVYVYSKNAVVATGGTITTLGEYKLHSFTTGGSSIFTVTDGSGTIETLLIAGGGSGGTGQPNGMSTYMTGGGGGAGGIVYASSVPVTPGNYPISVGNGGPGQASENTQGVNGTPTVAFGFTAVGGGGGGAQGFPYPSAPIAAATVGRSGGSGGGAGGQQTSVTTAGGPATQPGTPNPGAIQYGNPGATSTGPGSITPAGGGGGAGTPGYPNLAPTSPTVWGNGGDGIINPIVGSTIGVLNIPDNNYYIGGGGGGGAGPGAGGIGKGGLGGGGYGAGYPGINFSGAGAANVNTGGGGGGTHASVTPSGAGGTGAVIVKYRILTTFPSIYIP